MAEGGASPVPAGMVVRATRDAAGLVKVGAGGGAVLLGARPTGVVLLGAVGGQVIPAAAFKAMQGLFLTLLGVDLLVTYKEPISQCIVSRNGGGEGDNDMAAGL